MHLEPATLRTIVKRARTLSECREQDSQPITSKSTSAGDQPGRLDPSVSGGTDGLPGTMEGDDAPLPTWAVTLDQIISAIRLAFTAQAARKTIDQAVPKAFARTIPFAHLYWPICEIAWQGLRPEEKSATVLLRHRAREALNEWLLWRIHEVASSALQIDFQVEIASVRAESSSRMFGPESEPAAGQRDLYSEFITAQGQEGLAQFIMRYPVAARLMALIVENWKVTVGELFQRLEKDRRLLEARFNADSDLGSVRSIRAGMSDLHNGGRSVLILTFERGAQIVYKPRSMEVDRLFFGLIDKLNEHADNGWLQVLKVVDCGDYGWMEFVRSRGCQDEAGAVRFAHRAGALVCLVYWLRGVDGHRHNVVAAGEHPVLVDLEALAHPSLHGRKSRSADGPLPPLEECVLSTGLLPLQEKPAIGPGYLDYSGLCAPMALRHSLPTLRWLQINTGAMRAVRSPGIDRHTAHRLRIGRCLVDLRRWEEDVIRGYRQMGTLLTGQCCEDARRWAEKIQCARRRFIKRPTDLYRAVLARSLGLKCLGEGTARSAELETLPKGPSEEEWKKEVADLEGLDVPYIAISRSNCGDAAGLRSGDEIFAQIEIIRFSLRRKLGLHEGQLALARLRPKGQ